MPEMFEKAVKENDFEKIHKMISGTGQIPIGIRNKASQTGKGPFK
jgi:hypothetical protein